MSILIPGISAFLIAIIPESLSIASRFRYRHHPGIFIAIIPERLSPCPGLRSRGGGIYSLQQKITVSDKESAWDALLNVYGFTNLDELDLVLLQGIQSGFFDPSRLKKQALALDRKLIDAENTGRFRDAGRLFHDSFKDDCTEVLDGAWPICR